MPNSIVVDPSATADGSNSTGTKRATAALRVGMFTANNAWLSPSSTSTSDTEPMSRKACNQKRIDTTAIPALVTSSTARRSRVSAIAPPHSPNTSSGSRPTAPVNPT